MSLPIRSQLANIVLAKQNHFFQWKVRNWKNSGFITYKTVSINFMKKFIFVENQYSMSFYILHKYVIIYKLNRIFPPSFSLEIFILKRKYLLLTVIWTDLFWRRVIFLLLFEFCWIHAFQMISSGILLAWERLICAQGHDPKLTIG